MQINYYSMSPYDEDRANEKIVEIARKYGLNPGSYGTFCSFGIAG